MASTSSLDFTNLAAINKDGQLDYKSTATTKSGNTNVKDTAESKSSLDKDAFLQLLVAQMKYQDPMEPTENTEYISQFTAFSSLEQMQNMTASLDLQRASGMVGQYVIMKETNETTGKTTTTMGQVDYVFYEGNKAYLSVNGDDFSLDQLDTVIDERYHNATQLASAFADSLDKLPILADLTTGYKDVITNLRQVLNDMDAYERSFLPDTYVSRLGEYENRLNSLLKAEEEAAANKPDEEASDEKASSNAEAVAGEKSEESAE